MRRPSPRPVLLSTAMFILLVAMLLAPAQASTFSVTNVVVEMETSEDILVMNSDVDLTFTVTDKTTGDPITDCEVEVHIDRKTSDDDDGDDHMHTEPMEVPAGVPVPTVDIEVTEDPKSGWNLRVRVTNFEFDPANASTENVWGQGHAHLYMDDVKVGRLYTEWYHIGGLDKGEHTVLVTLNTNDHMDMAVDGVKVSDTATFTQEEDASHGHMTMPLYEVPDEVPTPGVDVTVHTDPKAGWNVQVETTDFRWAPQNASTMPLMGEGHAHIYVDDHKVARLYGGWYYLGALEEGEHQVRVTLNANNHSDYSKDGQVIEAVATVTVGLDAGDDGHGGDSVTVKATPGDKAGTYVVSHHFAKAGDYVIEVHVEGEGLGEMSKAFAVEVLEGDPAPVTIAGVIMYVALAIGAMILVQTVYTRRKVRRLQEVSRQSEEGMDGKGS